MSAETGPGHRIPVPRLARLGGHRFDIVPDAAARATLAAQLDLLDLRKLSLRGEIVPDGPCDWRLDATLGATVVQPCGITLAPVTTRIDEPVMRRYTPDAAVFDATPGAETESEMPEDDSIEPLGAAIDLDALLAEALSLALPPWPRAEGATLAEGTIGEGHATEDSARRPFAGLEGLRNRLAGEDDSDDTAEGGGGGPD